MEVTIASTDPVRVTTRTRLSAVTAQLGCKIGKIQYKRSSWVAEELRMLTARQICDMEGVTSVTESRQMHPTVAWI
jgi:hypothetical protein